MSEGVQAGQRPFLPHLLLNCNKEGMNRDFHIMHVGLKVLKLIAQAFEL